MSNEEPTEIKHKRQVIETKARRLRFLEKRAAAEGIQCDPVVLMEIEDLKKDIHQIKQEISELERALQVAEIVYKDISSDIISALQAALVSPYAASATLSRAIDQQLQIRFGRSIPRKGPWTYNSPLEAVEYGVRVGIYKADFLEMFRYFWINRNNAVHKTGNDVDSSTTIRLLYLGAIVLKVLASENEK